MHGPTPLRRHPPSCTCTHNPAAGGAWNCAANPPLQLQLTPRSLAYRILTLTGLDNTLPVITDPAG